MTVRKSRKNEYGLVYLVGAGPGDPGLLTLKALECLRRADYVFFDRLVNPEILKHCPSARLFDVGKRSYRGHFSQAKIEKLLIQAARKHRVVVRLKGGDPFVFGRGGEEAEALKRAGIAFEVVPGVSSAIAVPAYAGIPITHRAFGSSVAFVTGHEDPVKPHHLGESSSINWEGLAKIPSLVFLMGVRTLSENFEKLIAAGKSPKTPAAIVEWGTYPRQRSCVGDLRSLPRLAKKLGVHPPAITVVGDIVNLRDALSWYESKPLFGKRIVVTRMGEQASELSRRLREEGAQVLELSALTIRPPRSWTGTDRAIRQLGTYDWVLFSSVHAVEAFSARAKGALFEAVSTGRLKIAAVGPVTASRLEAMGFRVSRQGKSFTSDALANAFSARELSGRRILIPRAERAREEIVKRLRQKGAEVEVVVVYRSQAPKYSRKKVLQSIGETTPDLITFASGATAENFSQIVRTAGLWPILYRAPVAAIGPVTRDAARSAGFRVVAMPDQHTIEGLVAAISRYFSGKSSKTRGARKAVSHR